MKKNIILLSLLSTLTLIVSVSVYQYLNNNESIIDYKQFNLSVKNLRTVENDDGTISKIMSFDYTPTDADLGLAISFANSDGTYLNPDGLFTTVISYTDKTITVNCLKAFDDRKRMTIRAIGNSSCTADVDLYYEKKLLSISGGAGVDGIVDLFSDLSGNADIILNGEAPMDNLLFVPSYSIYTNDKTYSFDLNITNSVLNENYDFLINKQYDVENVESSICGCVELALVNKTILTPSIIYEIFESENINSTQILEYLSALSTNKIEFGVDVDYLVTGSNGVTYNGSTLIEFEFENLDFTNI